MITFIEKLYGIDHAKIANLVIVILYEQPYLKEIDIQLVLATEYDTVVGRKTLERLLRWMQKAGVLQSQLSQASDGEPADFWYLESELVANLPRKT